MLSGQSCPAEVLAGGSVTTGAWDPRITPLPQLRLQPQGETGPGCTRLGARQARSVGPFHARLGFSPHDLMFLPAEQTRLKLPPQVFPRSGKADRPRRPLRWGSWCVRSFLTGPPLAGGGGGCISDGGSCAGREAGFAET